MIVPYVDYWSNLFYLNESFSAAIHKRADDCGYTSYLEKYLTFPPPAGKFPLLPDPFATDSYTCDVFDDVYFAELEINPCFNIYHITDTCPHLSTVLGIVNTGDYLAPGEVTYFNRSDVQKAINAPVGTDWKQCTDINVFGGASDNKNLSDTSLGPAQDGVLQHVIESINNTIIGVGNLDFLLPTNGTLLALQNVTWNGVQGFQSFPGTEFYTPYHPEYNGGALAGAGKVGLWGSERGLTFYQVQLAGHGKLPLPPPFFLFYIYISLKTPNPPPPPTIISSNQTKNQTQPNQIPNPNSQSPTPFPILINFNRFSQNSPATPRGPPIASSRSCSVG